MNDFKLCPNGHYYQKNLAECPYCPQKNLSSEQDDLNITKITQPKSQNMQKDLHKTQIITPDDTQQNNTTTPQRKLVGWLVSFTHDPLGKDFKLYEGRNSIGSDSGCDIILTNDSAISGKHLTILFRMDAFKFKDELSTNGTFINDEFVEEGNLNDGDVIRLGNTILKFRSVQ